MPLISGDIPNFINGVSQQPQSLRNPSQAAAQFNALSTASKGLRKRPLSTLEGFVVLSALGLDLSDPDNLAYHAYKRSDDEKYLMIIEGATGQLIVYDYTNNTITGATDTYFQTPNARRDIRFLTVADTTFVLNKSVVPQQSAVSSQPIPGQLETLIRHGDLYIVVQQGNYGKTYSVTVNFTNAGSITASYTTANGGSAADSNDISTENIATNLFNTLQSLITASPSLNGKVFIARYGNVINLYNYDEFSANIRGAAVVDGFGGNAMYAFSKQIDDFSKLPNRASPQSVVKVVEGVTTDNKGYYVRFTGNPGENTGVWRECVTYYADPDAMDGVVTPAEPRLSAGLDPTTMPQRIVNTGVGAFTLSAVPWNVRAVGDSASAPDPAFVGRGLNDLCFHRNRLGLIYDDGIAMSESDNYFNLYPTTVVQVLDTEAIDVQVNTTNVDKLYGSAPFDKDLFLFGERNQYRLSGEPLLTPKTVDIKLVTSYDTTDSVRPRTIGSRIVFPANRGVYASFREMYLNTETVLDAPLFTAHVPEYVPASPRGLCHSTTEDVMFACPLARDGLYVYSYYYGGQEKLMSSWSTWTYSGASGDILHPVYAECFGSELLVVLLTDTGILVTTTDLSYSNNGTLGTYGTAHMDFVSKYEIGDFTLNAAGTAYEAPISSLFVANIYNPDRFAAVGVSSTSSEAGKALEVELDTVNNLVRITGIDINQFDNILVGNKFDMSYTLSEVYTRRGNAQGGTTTDKLAKLMLKRFEVTVENTPSLTATVVPEGRPANVTTLPRGAEITLAEYAGNYAYVPFNGEFRFAVNTKNVGTLITLSDSSVHPVNLLSATWQAQYVREARAT